MKEKGYLFRVSKAVRLRWTLNSLKKQTKILLFIMMIVSLSLLLMREMQAFAKEKEGCNIAIALDVSGSMVTTDENRLSIEMIEMLIDLCDEKDSIAVIAYNDFLVYESKLVSMSDKHKKEQLKAEVRQLEFKGETDNGLGLKTAMDILTQDESGKKSYVLFISDGKTDLANSLSDRTQEKSQADWEESCKTACEKGIEVHTISFVNEYSKDTTEMTIASQKTGGISSVVANPLQFTKAIVETWFAYQGQKNIKVHTLDTTQELSKLEIDTSRMQSNEITFVGVSTENLSAFEMLIPENEVTLDKNNHYAVAKIQNPSKETVYAMFSSDTNGILSWSLVDSGEIPVVKEEKEEPKQLEIGASPPIARQSMQEKVYISKGMKRYDVSTLFEDADGDIVKYEMEVEANAGIEANLQGTMLSVTPKADEKATIAITATDASGLEARTEAVFICIPKWKEHYSLIIGLIIAVIVSVTFAICFFLYKVIFKKEEKKVVGFSGVLQARFIDLKSKNDIPSLSFALEDYPPEELSLKELLESIGVHEDLPDLENVHFAPYKKNQIRFVHDIEGGVFIGDDSLTANKVTVIEAGTKIYISFAENASEYELRYVAKGMA